jgi:hypothetical protein
MIDEKKLAQPHLIQLPDGKTVRCECYQAAWLQRNVEAWKRGHDPKDYPILTEDGEDPKGYAEVEP